MAADRWGVSWGGDAGIWGYSWSLGNSPVTTNPAYGAPFLTLTSPMKTTVNLGSELTTTINLYSDIDEQS